MQGDTTIALEQGNHEHNGNLMENDQVGGATGDYHNFHNNGVTSTPTSKTSTVRARISIESNRKRAGFILLIIVVFLWGGSSFLLQKLFTLIRYSKPLLTTLIQTSLTSLLLIPKLVQRWKASRAVSQPQAEEEQLALMVLEQPLDAQDSVRVEIVTKDNENRGDSFNPIMASSTSSNTTVEVPSPRLNELSIALLQDHQPSHDELQTTDAKQASPPPTVLCSWEATIPLGLLWFGGQICFNLSLMYATVPTSIIVSSTSIFFTYALMIAIFGEHFDVWNFLAMLMSFFGVGLVASNTPIHRNLGSVKDTPLGYTLSLISAISYAFFVTYLKHWSSKSCSPPPESSTISDILSLGDLDSPEKDVSSSFPFTDAHCYHSRREDNPNNEATNSTGIPNSPTDDILASNDLHQHEHSSQLYQVQQVASTLDKSTECNTNYSDDGQSPMTTTLIGVYPTERTTDPYATAASNSLNPDTSRQSQQHQGYYSQESSDYDRSDDFISFPSGSISHSPRQPPSSRVSLHTEVTQGNHTSSVSPALPLSSQLMIGGQDAPQPSASMVVPISPSPPYSLNLGQQPLREVCFRQRLTSTQRDLRRRVGGLTNGTKGIPKTVAEEELEMTSLFGSIGLMIAVCAPFLIIFAHLTYLERFEVPSQVALEWMLVNGLLGTVLSNYLWGLTVILLNPIVTTIGTNLQIPLVILADSSLLLDHRFKVLYVIGSLMTLVGVIIVSIRTTRASNNKDNTDDQIALHDDAEDDQDSIST